MENLSINLTIKLDAAAINAGVNEIAPCAMEIIVNSIQVETQPTETDAAARTWQSRYGEDTISQNQNCCNHTQRVNLQKDLNCVTESTLTPDGYYGAQTAAAVREFQGSAGLYVDGIAGPNTKYALYQAAGDRNYCA
jgi:peptidoglycan hydrolase-like protein with peptidoglycan-binding domain